MLLRTLTKQNEGVISAAATRAATYFIHRDEERMIAQPATDRSVTKGAL